MYIRTIATTILVSVFAAAAACASGDETLQGLQDKPQFMTMKTQVGKDLADHQRYR
jgi:hypothetical protein